MPRTVLLVDEDAAALADLRRTLHGSPYRVLSARGARPAFEVLALEPVHVIVCGSTPSDTTGVDFLARARLRHPNTVRVLMAVGTEVEAAERAVSEGTVHFALSRPPGPDLVEAIARGLEDTRPAARDATPAARHPPEDSGKASMLASSPALSPKSVVGRPRLRNHPKLRAILAAVALVTVAASLWVSHRLLLVHVESVHIDEEWTERQNRVLALGHLLALVDDQMHALLASEEAGPRLRAGLFDLNREIILTRESLAREVGGTEVDGIASELAAVDRARAVMEANADRIVAAARNVDAGAVLHAVTSMQRARARASAAIDRARDRLADVRRDRLAAGTAMADALARVQHLLLLWVVTLVGCAAVVSSRMSRQAVADARRARASHPGAARERIPLPFARGGRTRRHLPRRCERKASLLERALAGDRRMAEPTRHGGVWEDSIHPDDRAAVSGQWADAVRSGSAVFGSFRIVQPSGAVRWVDAQAAVVRDDHGDPIGFIGTTDDVTERKQADDALRESEERFRVLAETVPEIIFTIRPDGVCDYVTGHFYEYTGAPPARRPGSAWMHPDDLEAARAPWIHASRSGGACEVRYRLRRADGAYRWFIGRMRAIRDERDEVIEWLPAPPPTSTTWYAPRNASGHMPRRWSNRARAPSSRRAGSRSRRSSSCRRATKPSRRRGPSPSSSPT